MITRIKSNDESMFNFQKNFRKKNIIFLNLSSRRIQSLSFAIVIVIVRFPPRTQGQGIRLFIAVASNRWRGSVRCTRSPSPRIFAISQLEEELQVEGRHGSAPSKIIPWSVSWHPMIVRQRLESVGLSLGVHVRLARVSCGATLPIPGCLQDCNIVSGRGRVSGGTGRGREGKERLAI